MGNALRFVREHGQDVRCVRAWHDNPWLVWDGRRWAVDELGRVEGLAKRTAKGMWAAIGGGREGGPPRGPGKGGGGASGAPEGGGRRRGPPKKPARRGSRGVGLENMGARPP